VPRVAHTAILISGAGDVSVGGARTRPLSGSGREIRRERRVRCKPLARAMSTSSVSGSCGSGTAAINRTHRGAGFVIEEANALGALLGHDIEDVEAKGRLFDALEFPLHATLVNGGVRALGFAWRRN